MFENCRTTHDGAGSYPRTRGVQLSVFDDGLETLVSQGGSSPEGCAWWKFFDHEATKDVFASLPLADQKSAHMPVTGTVTSGARKHFRWGAS